MRFSTAIFICALGFYLCSILFYLGGSQEMSDNLVTMAVCMGIGSVAYKHLERLDCSYKTSNQNNQDKNAIAMSGGNAEKGTSSLPSEQNLENPQDDSGWANVASSEDTGDSTFPADSSLAYKKGKEALKRLRMRN